MSASIDAASIIGRTVVSAAPAAHALDAIAPAATRAAHAADALAGPAQARDGRSLVIAVLGTHDNPSVHAIARELTSIGVSAPIIDLADVGLQSVGRGVARQQSLTLAGAPLQALDGAIAYHGAMVPTGGMEKMRAMERAGVTFFNPPASITASRDKWLTADALQSAGVSTPTTRLMRTGDDVDTVLAEIGTPAVFKLRVGTEGRGVFKVDNPDLARPMAETVFSLRRHLVGQEMVQMTHPADVRAFVVDGRVVASMERTAPVRAGGVQDFRTNVSNGGTARAIEQLHPADEATAINAAKALGLDVSGVDLMGDPGVMRVIEANSGPGQKIAEITGVNVAREIAEAAVRKVTAAAEVSI